MNIKIGVKNIFVIVMGIIKCEKVFPGIFILIENKLEKLKITTKNFRTHDTHFNNIYSFIQYYSNYLKVTQKIKLLNHLVVG